MDTWFSPQQKYQHVNVWICVFMLVVNDACKCIHWHISRLSLELLTHLSPHTSTHAHVRVNSFLPLASWLTKMAFACKCRGLRFACVAFKKKKNYSWTDFLKMTEMCWPLLPSHTCKDACMYVRVTTFSLVCCRSVLLTNAAYEQKQL